MVNVGVTSLYSLEHERYNMLTTADRQLWSMWGSHRSIVWDMKDICKPSLVPRFLMGKEKRAWYQLFAYDARNYPLLNTCLGKSGRGMRNTYPRD